MKTQKLSKPIYLLKGVLFAFIITIVLIIVFSLLLTYTSISENKMSLFNTLVMIISITFGSIYVAVMIKEKGWINGGIVGIVYYLILILLNLIFLKSYSLDMFSFSKFIIAIITGIIGGVIGINIS